MGMSIRGYARHRNCSPSSVMKALATGRITKQPDGTIDPEQADLEWAANTRQPATVTHTWPDGVPPLEKSRAEREHYRAKIIELELGVREGRLLDATEISRQVFTQARETRDRLQQIPRTLAPDIVAAVVADPGNTATVETLLERAFGEALAGLGATDFSAVDDARSA